MPRALRIKCPTWDHVERFYARKLDAAGQLSLKLPFSPQSGQKIGLVLELPNAIEIAIPCEVTAATLGPDRKKSAVSLKVAGDVGQLIVRLRALTADGRAEAGGASAIDALVAPPAPMPLDAPVDEKVTPAPAPAEPRDAEPLTGAIVAELEALRAKPAHEVLGVAWDASVADIRRGYFALVKKWHPDVHARHRSPAIASLVSELFIHINRAYDRMRDAAVAAGAAIAPGPALIPHGGWMAEISDIDSGGVTISSSRFQVDSRGAARGGGNRRDLSATKAEGKVPLTVDSLFGDLDLDASAANADGAAPLDISGASAAEVAAYIASDDAETAARIAAESLTKNPRNRQLRALYHTACAHTLVAEDKAVAAVTELETALAHDPDCELAQNLAAAIAAKQGKKSPRLSRLFHK